MAQSRPNKCLLKLRSLRYWRETYIALIDLCLVNGYWVSHEN